MHKICKQGIDSNGLLCTDSEIKLKKDVEKIYTQRQDCFKAHGNRNYYDGNLFVL